MTKISTKTLLHMTFCKRCVDGEPDMNLCTDCIIAYPKAAAEAAREFVEKEKQND